MSAARPAGSSGGPVSYIPSMTQVRKYTAAALSQPINLIWLFLRMFQRRAPGLPTQIMITPGMVYGYSVTFLTDQQANNEKKNLPKGSTIRALTTAEAKALYATHAVLRTQNRYKYFLIGYLFDMSTAKYLNADEAADPTIKEKYKGMTIRALSTQEQSRAPLLEEQFYKVFKQ